MADTNYHYGLDAELKAKADAKYDPKLEAEAKNWIEAVTGESFGDASFADFLKSGQVLCKLANCIQPGLVKKVNKNKLPFMQMENISNFISACEKLNVPKNDLFQTVDLFEAKNVFQVVMAIHALGRAAQRVSSFNGPQLGVKLADKNERTFDEATLAKGRAEMGYVDRDASKKQQLASAANVTINDSIAKNRQTAVDTGLSYTDSKKSDIQKLASAGHRREADNIILTKDKAVASSELGYVDSKKSDIQKLASEGHARGTDNIIMTSNTGTQTGELGYADKNKADVQKLANAANRQSENIVRTDGKSSNEGQLSMAEQNALKSQKLSNDSRKYGREKIIMTQN